MNANGDERIDHDEFVGFFLKVMMGTPEQKLMICFKIYDVEFDESIAPEEIKIVLSHIPLWPDKNYGITNPDSKEANLNRVDLLKYK